MSSTEQLLQLIRQHKASSSAAQPSGTISTRLKFSEVAALYETVGHRDTEYLDWLHEVHTSMALPCVGVEFKQTLGDDKTKMAVFDIMLDDLADNFVTRSRFLLEDFMRIPWHGSVERHDYVNVGRVIWEDFIDSVQKYPRYKELEAAFYFDLRQILSSNDYSSLVNSIGLDNPFEMNHYSPYGCAVMLFIDMDIMCMPDFDLKELRTMRSISYLAQKIAHIANVLGTYPREVLERDLSSPMISLALRKGIISKDELGDRVVLEKLKQLEWIFRSRAQSYVERVSTYEKQVRSIDIRGFSGMLEGLVEKWATGPEASVVLRP